MAIGTYFVDLGWIVPEKQSLGIAKGSIRPIDMDRQ